MPYGKKKVAGKWVVYNKKTGRVFGKHDREAGADAQIAALYANVKEK